MPSTSTSTSTTDSCRFLPSEESSSRPRVNQFQPAAPLEIFRGTVTAIPAAPLSFRSRCRRIWVTYVSEPRQEDTLQIASVLYYITFTLNLERIRKRYYIRYQLISNCLTHTRSHRTKFAGAQGIPAHWLQVWGRKLNEMASGGGEEVWNLAITHR